jgi:DNA mismatch endonuclease (patch repair protein)
MKWLSAARSTFSIQRPMAVPSFKGFRSSSETASHSKRNNRSRDTNPELLLRRQLWQRGLRYRLHAKDIPGKPDIVFRAKRVVVFCDGDFWHGRDWVLRRRRLAQGANAGYWVAKIKSNIERDERVDSTLRRDGWLVIRVWEADIKSDPTGVADRMKEILDRRGEELTSPPYTTESIRI